MFTSRRILGFLNAAIVVAAASGAFAQSPPASVPSDAYREWPASSQDATRPNMGMNYDAVDSEGSGAIPALPLEVQTVGAVTYVTGGVGDEEIAQLKASEREYNLHILMNAPGGAFVSDVSVHITDAAGKDVLSITGAGPYFYAKLPVGAYTVALSSESQTKQLHVKIKANKDSREIVQFKESPGFITPHQGTATVE